MIKRSKHIGSNWHKPLVISVILLISSLVYSQDTILKLSHDTIVYRYGDKIAEMISAGKVVTGFSKTMVYHAKGPPYLIEEPLGKMMDFEILYYLDMIIFIEYGQVAYLRNLKKESLKASKKKSNKKTNK